MFILGVIRSILVIFLLTYILQWLVALILIISGYMCKKRSLKLTEDDVADIHWKFILSMLIEIVIVIVTYGFIGLIYYTIN